MNLKDLTLARSNERIDDLERNGYKIIQNPEVFCFGIDAILLAHFAKVTKASQKILDIGTGTGIIPILMHAAYQKGSYIGIDIQPDMVEMANRSSKLNQIEESVKFLNIDIKQYKDNFKWEQFDIITTNPPYMKGEAGLKNEHPSIRMARHEVSCTLEDIIVASSFMLKNRGKLYMIHRPHRLIDIMSHMRNYKLEPKRMRFVHPKPGKAPTMVLIEAVRNGGPELRVEPPLMVYNEQGVYTDEIYDIYGKIKEQSYE
ncbi:tRNA1(Val) (adenine(37)-N6)-methyltransferase [Cellulosilyticum sp. I15G10I2]|uniref:tRNA1(Val) (adenine(37)-N6)-methyltransferase n=1 Tax=Cellulosilyticum sp. I15G10I2 TaxID=1892843 RepID=UPI00085C7A3D